MYKYAIHRSGRILRIRQIQFDAKDSHTLPIEREYILSTSIYILNITQYLTQTMYLFPWVAVESRSYDASEGNVTDFRLNNQLMAAIYQDLPD